MTHRTELPPQVEAHVQHQVERTDWERLLRDMRTLCADCPADRDPDICINCPLEGIAVDAATLTLRAQIAKLQKSKTRKMMGGQIINRLKDGQTK